MYVKYTTMLLTGLLLSLSGCSYKESAESGLNGKWLGDYNCPNVSGEITEEIEIKQDADFYLIATKITGDDCVPAGNVTFEGRISQSITCIGGYPDSPASASFESLIKIEDANNFEVCNVRFKRKNS